jgi:hypothetical protein
MSHGGKGYAQRPTVVDQEVMESNWNRIFGNRNKSSASQKTGSSQETSGKEDATCLGEEKASSQKDG